eukprot:TRINITY_DN400_c0_g4_i1.p1 TRINITY_DN400_c0_g4~~TRINITY_DN400_c0_g4_i1.p1  ORF type:complete len:733 (+),score=267.79 TRINITY_DN400_c0_g4_i1:96-2201(+)
MEGKGDTDRVERREGQEEHPSLPMNKGDSLPSDVGNFMQSFRKIQTLVEDGVSFKDMNAYLQTLEKDFVHILEIVLSENTQMKDEIESFYGVLQNPQGVSVEGLSSGAHAVVDIIEENGLLRDKIEEILQEYSLLSEEKESLMEEAKKLRDHESKRKSCLRDVGTLTPTGMEIAGDTRVSKILKKDRAVLKHRETEIIALKKMLQEKEKENETLRKQLADDKRNSEKRIKEMESLLDMRTRSFEQKMKVEEEKRKKEMESLKLECDSRLKDIDQKRASSIVSLEDSLQHAKEEHAAMVEMLVAKHQKDLEEEEKSKKEEISALEEQHEHDLEELKEVIRKLAMQMTKRGLEKNRLESLVGRLRRELLTLGSTIREERQKSEKLKKRLHRLHHYGMSRDDWEQVIDANFEELQQPQTERSEHEKDEENHHRDYHHRHDDDDDDDGHTESDDEDFIDSKEVAESEIESERGQSPDAADTRGTWQDQKEEHEAEEEEEEQKEPKEQNEEMNEDEDLENGNEMETDQCLYESGDDFEDVRQKNGEEFQTEVEIVDPVIDDDQQGQRSDEEDRRKAEENVVQHKPEAHPGGAARGKGRKVSEKSSRRRDEITAATTKKTTMTTTKTTTEIRKKAISPSPRIEKSVAEKKYNGRDASQSTPAPPSSLSQPSTNQPLPKVEMVNGVLVVTTPGGKKVKLEEYVARGTH